MTQQITADERSLMKLEKDVGRLSELLENVREMLLDVSYRLDQIRNEQAKQRLSNMHKKVG